MSKSSPSGSPRSTWSLGEKANGCGSLPVGLQRRNSTLPCSSAPTGTLSLGKFGTASSRVCKSACKISRRAADCSSSVLISATCAISASALSPFDLRIPICLDTVLRIDCNSSVRVCNVLRSFSNVWNASTFKKTCGDLRVSSRAITCGKSRRNRLMSNIYFNPLGKGNLIVS